MKISLIGMSGTGKSYWSKKLEEQGFIRYCCDDFIEKKLNSVLQSLGYSGINDVSKWMGQPYDSRYTETSKIYLDLEAESMGNIFAYIDTLPEEKNVVIDTTGSIIYLRDDVINKLKYRTEIIFLNTPESVRQEMLELYIKDPKPVIWGDVFNQRIDETQLQALARCYPKLLEYRTQLYAKYADKQLDYFFLRNPKTDIQVFLETITDN